MNRKEKLRWLGNIAQLVGGPVRAAVVIIAAVAVAIGVVECEALLPLLVGVCEEGST